MPSSDACWGIDLGQCALKAIRCRPHEKPTRVIADAFDYIEYPKLLNQPEADPVELIQDALEQFLSRNTIKGDKVAISVPGQSGLARFIKLPPVESKKIPDIVKYEARQQIPFPLDDVVWDYQQLAGGSEEEGFALETEVGIFAMKRDQVFRALKPFRDAEIEVDIIQLAPLSLFNFVVFDQMHKLPPPEEFDPDNPPESVALLSLGTETTDLVITNGYRVWQRNIPIGGNHFTKALSKELKLTFAKAEHLKRNAKQADDPKAVFRAMRPVFNDLLTEIQRSISFFSSIDREAKIKQVIGLGNAMKLPALDRFISQNMGYEVTRLESFARLSGSSVVESPSFKDNILSFGAAYGLALQGTRDVRLKTSLMPREVVVERLVREKKPWAVAAAALLLLGLSISFFGHWRVWNSVQSQYEHGGVTFENAVSAADRVAGDARRYESDYQAAASEFAAVDQEGQILIRPGLRETQWLEVSQAINACLPHETLPDDPDAKLPKIDERSELHITQVECKRVTDVGPWFQRVKEHPPYSGELVRKSVRDKPPPTDEQGNPLPVQPPQPPTGEGWIFRLKGYHFHNGNPADRGPEFVLRTLVENLHKDTVNFEGRQVPVGDLGLGYAVLIDPQPINFEFEINDPESNTDPPQKIKMPRFDFEVQFCWQPDKAGESDQQPAAPAGTVAGLTAGRTN